jgi:heme exporter protein C
MLKPLKALAAPQAFYHFTGALIPWLWGITVLALGYGLWGGLYAAPADYQQGEGFRIIYVHVPAAFLSLAIYSWMAALAASYLIWRIKIVEVLMMSIAPIGAMFTFLALVTGAIWGKPMWGTWWVWDARLTSELILLFLYLGVIALKNAITHPKVAAKACAILTLVGFIDIPIIHYSVQWWFTLHQGATLSFFAPPKIAMSMLIPLLSMLIGFVSYALAIWFIYARAKLLDREYEKIWVKNMLQVAIK